MKQWQRKNNWFNDKKNFNNGSVKFVQNFNNDKKNFNNCGSEKRILPRF